MPAFVPAETCVVAAASAATAAVEPVAEPVHGMQASGPATLAAAAVVAAADAAAVAAAAADGSEALNRTQSVHKKKTRNHEHGVFQNGKHPSTTVRKKNAEETGDISMIPKRNVEVPPTTVKPIDLRTQCLHPLRDDAAANLYVKPMPRDSSYGAINSTFLCLGVTVLVVYFNSRAAALDGHRLTRSFKLYGDFDSAVGAP